MSPRRRIVEADVLVIGSGIAGLVTAPAASPHRVVVATKGRLWSGSTPYAQGGIAAAVGERAHPSLHAADRLTDRIRRESPDPVVTAGA